MARHGKSDFHNGRVYGADRPAGDGLLGWLRRQFEKMLRAGGDPGPETILFTHALDDQFRRAGHPGAPFEGDPR